MIVINSTALLENITCGLIEVADIELAESHIMEYVAYLVSIAGNYEIEVNENALGRSFDTQTDNEYYFIINQLSFWDWHDLKNVKDKAK